MLEGLFWYISVKRDFQDLIFELWNTGGGVFPILFKQTNKQQNKQELSKLSH